MVITTLRQQAAPIGVAVCARILGLDPKTLNYRIATGKFPSAAVLQITPEDTRIDPQALATYLERQQGVTGGSIQEMGHLIVEQYEENVRMAEHEAKIGWQIDPAQGIRCQYFDYVPIKHPEQLAEFIGHIKYKNWVTKDTLNNVIQLWALAYGGAQ